jgi:hypothetical protein
MTDAGVAWLLPLSVPLKKMEALVLPGLRRNEDGEEPLFVGWI